MYGSLLIMEGSLLSRFLLLPCHYGRYYVVNIFVIPMDGSLVILEHSYSMDGSLVIMEGSLLSIFLLL